MKCESLSLPQQLWVNHHHMLLTRFDTRSVSLLEPSNYIKPYPFVVSSAHLPSAKSQSTTTPLCTAYTNQVTNPSLPKLLNTKPLVLSPTAMRNNYEISSKEEHQAKRRELNPDVDRAPAKVRDGVNSKLRIQLTNIEGGNPIDIQYSASIDWTSQASITALNRWRKDIFAHNLGPLNKQETRGTTNKEIFLDHEISWLAAYSGVFLYQDNNCWYRGWYRSLGI